MKLSAYLELKDITVRDFAYLNGFATMTVYNWINEKVIPLRSYQKTIMEATKGKVAYADWRELNKQLKRRKDETTINTDKGSGKTDGMHSAKHIRNDSEAKPQGKKGTGEDLHMRRVDSGFLRK